ncbi:autotransporter outer membrane beta-barrel domain-containing protein [Pusillimonas sp. MFBS29]|uniref:autotransporter outer membrane beta-barrel domain-containing protein n=1 Tax=Pusillimonas sp. MFBS29 TaxID=2886690 RepID=UPI002102F80B|nr:autotransporter outer membrane beta-barrel domain-containing protein [Pusillimonas sp. MFBS29]
MRYDRKSVRGSRRINRIFTPTLLRVLILSGLGVGGVATGEAQASCSSSPEGEFSYYYQVCNGSSGIDDDDDARTGGEGDSIEISTSGAYAIDAGEYPDVSKVGTGGVIMGQSRGGNGAEEGDAGSGGSVTLDNSASILLDGTSNSGYFGSLISAFSLGGNGDTDNQNNDSDGGRGGWGQSVQVSNSGDITMSGSVQAIDSGMYGIIAVSGGGTGGEQNDSVVDNQYGGDGGYAGAVTVSNSGVINLGSDDSRMQAYGDYIEGAAIYADSGGGAGGPDNGNAGNGDTVTVDHSGQINSYWTGQGDGNVYGINARSIGGLGMQSFDDSDDGGLGGNGGMVNVVAGGSVLLDVDGTFEGTGAAIAARSIGSKGGTGPGKDNPAGNGGMGSAVTVSIPESSARITTHGNNLVGIRALSLGGQGGDGGDAAALAGEGGGGGFGGNASPVSVETAAGSLIATSGNFATGIAAHSIGGGGGTGSEFVSVLGGQGGNGGNGGDASTVDISAAGNITTQGEHAYGILGQSIAGSGGAGGVNVSSLVSLGGDGAGGGQASSVDISNAGDLSTAGYSSHGILAQSIGGGGGASGSSIGLLSIGGSAAGSSGSQGGDVLVNNAGAITTQGNAAMGMIVQSIGGGGGSGGDSVGVVGVGGDGAAGGNGGTVTVRDLGTIQTSGNFALGALAQSIGGGGGNGGDTFTASAGVTLAVGGSADGGGDGGLVCMGNGGGCDGWTSDQASQVKTHGDYSMGVVAQSVGGGGGNGGSVDNVSVASFAALRIGGTGGAGGNAGQTRVSYKGLDVQTEGAHAIGVLAQSVGGGGGNGGDSNYFNVSAGFSASVALGGSGGTGGVGQKAEVDLQDTRITTGMDLDNPDPMHYAPNESFGVVAQTIGGGGGNGGSVSARDIVVAIPTSLGKPLAINMTAAIGGSGGAGGDACPDGDSNCITRVSLTDGSAVATLGDGSHAVVAQSLGGGGGNGGDASVLSGTIGYKNALTLTAGVALGGSGDSGGDGGNVQVTLGDAEAEYAALPSPIQLPLETVAVPASSIVTYGNYADGLLAQAIGGGGGNGGVGSSNAYATGRGMDTIKLTIGLGGTGGYGGAAGNVDVALNPNFTINTLSSGSRGIVAQSIGGGGGASQGGTVYLSLGKAGTPKPDGTPGKSKSARVGISVGMEGGSGGDGSGVTANIDGAIRTAGGDADGVLLQSIGGGGGLGGSMGGDASSHPILTRVGIYRDNTTRLTDAGSAYSLNVTVGGRGGSGGHGGSVDLDYAGKIATSGDWADGIVAQSIGGGGGAGGSATATGSKIAANVLVGVGGTGGVGGDGGTVTAKFDGSHQNVIQTAGYGAYGVVLQSVGGGGGQGGDGSDRSRGTMSIGGTSGGDGGTAGNGGTVQIIDLDEKTSWLTLKTMGSDAMGVVAQSVGGGGGIGGMGSSQAALLQEDSHSITLSVGGHGGVAGNGGEVNMKLGTELKTEGERSHGIVAQSVGGGGGIGGVGRTGRLQGLALGGRGGAAGDGGAVTLDLLSGTSITTSGAGAHGIIAQSVGGGGGIAGDTTIGIQLGSQYWAAGTLSGSLTGGNGSGGAVAVNLDGTIQTTGDHAYGLIAQSIGGGGGLGGRTDGGFAGSTAAFDNTGRGQDVTVTQAGDIHVSGQNSTGIFAQSTGPEGSGNITVNVNGTVTGGSGSNASAVWFAGSGENTLNVSSEGAVVAGPEGQAVRQDGSIVQTNDSGEKVEASMFAIRNAGRISGNVSCGNGLDGSSCHIENQAGGLLSNATLYQADLLNAGTLVIGRPAAYDKLIVTGNMDQIAAGTLQSDVDFDRLRAGHMVVQGHAKLAGQVNVQPTALLPDREVTIVKFEGGHDSDSPIRAKDSPVVDYEARIHDSALRVRPAAADFATPAMKLAISEDSVAQHVQRGWGLGGNSEMAPLFAALDMTSRMGAGEYSERLQDLSVGVGLAPGARALAGMSRFTGAMMSCPAFQQEGSLAREQDCVWGQFSGRTTNQDGARGLTGFSYDTLTYQFGGQKQVSPGWFVGGSAAYENTHMSSDFGRVTGEGDRGYAGVVVKREVGPWTFSGALSAGYGNFDLERRIRLPGLESRAKADLDIYGAGLKLRMARTFAGPAIYVKPYLDLDAFYTHTPAYTESRNASHLEVESNNQFVMGVSPMIEFGGRVELDNGAVLRPYLYGGVTFLSENEYSVEARFQSAPEGAGKFETTIPMDDVIGRVGAGLQISNVSGIDFRLEYEGEFSEHVRSHRGMLKVMMPF